MQTDEELERKLWIASYRYLNGEISFEDLQKLEDMQAERFMKAMYILAKRRVRQEFLKKVHGIFFLFRNPNNTCYVFFI
jgi:hypothetical protein